MSRSFVVGKRNTRVVCGRVCALAVVNEQTMVAMQKAQIGFSAALQVRNKMVQAYTDIMQMQV